MELKTEKKKWVDPKTGEVNFYNVYYVEVQGIKIFLKPVDVTGRQLLDHVLKK